MSETLERAVEVFRRLLRQRKQTRKFAGWASTEESLRERDRQTALELEEAQQRYLNEPE